MRTAYGYEWRIGRIVIDLTTRRNVRTSWCIYRGPGPPALEMGRLVLWLEWGK